MIIRESFFRDIARIIVWYPLRFVISILPVKSFFLICKAMAVIHFFVAHKQKKSIIRNIKHVFGKDINVSKCCRKYLEMHYIDRMWIFYLPKINKDNINSIHSIKGIEYLNEALKMGKGCILVHGHLGPSQMPLLELNLRGYKVTQIGYHSEEHLSYIGEKVALRLRKKYEGMIPAKIIFGDQFLRPIFTTLRNNEIIMTAGDGTGGGKYIGKYIPVKFLGEMIPFPVGPITLSKKTGAPILHAFTLRNGNSKFMTVIEKPPPMNSAGNDDKDIANNLLIFAEHLETNVRNYPDLWHFWEEFTLMQEEVKKKRVFKKLVLKYPKIIFKETA